MSVVGFDIGNETSYIASVKSGGIEILDNEYNIRSTPTYVAFSEKSRDVGVAAKAKLVTNLENTVFGFKRILGGKSSDPNIAKELEYLPYEVAQLASGNIGIKVNYLKKDVTFTVTQLMAMMLSKLKMISENKLCSKIRDCVISVPVYYTDSQRRAMLNAAKIANLNPLRLMNESAAVALGYGFYKQDLSDQFAQNVIFIDMGNSSITVTACAFTKEKLKILGCVWDDVGGRDFDNTLVQYFVDDFKEKYKLDVMSCKKALMALMLECESLKKLMSANSLELGIQIECFMDDIDVKGRMKRDLFEKLSVDVLNRVENTLNRILEETHLTNNNIDAVEIIGGSCRLPAIKILIQKVFGREPNCTLNQDEAVSRGCALQCALLSPSLKTRQFVIEDVASFSIQVTWLNMEGNEEELEVFSRFDKVPNFKMISIPMAKPFNLKAYYINHRRVSEKCEIGNFKIGNIPNVENGFAKIKIKACLNIHSVFSIPSAEMTVRSVSGENRVVPFKDKSSEEMDVTTEEENKEIAEKDAQNGKPASCIKSYELSVTSEVPELSQSELNENIGVEKEMIHKYIQEKELADARNSLEEYIYDARGKLNYELSEFVEEEVKEKLLEYLYDTESWIYDSELLEAYEFSQKLQQSKKHFDPIFKRYGDWNQIPAVIGEYRQSLQQAMDSINELVDMDEKNNYHSRIENLKELWQNSEQLLDQSMKMIATKKKFEDPSVEDLKEALAEFRKEFQKSYDELKEKINASEGTAESSGGDGNASKMEESVSQSQTSTFADENDQPQQDV